MHMHVIAIFGMAVLGICGPATLEAQVQSWNQVLNTKRFQLLSPFNNEAVLDRETGLVWEQAPPGQDTGWAQAQLRCNQLTLGNRRGWRLPTIQELESLLDPSVPLLALPAGHPFGTIDPNIYYWSATANAFDPSRMWVMTFADGRTAQAGRCVPGSGCSTPVVPISVWCVRGGAGTDAQ
jgi:hypothetical protein